MPVLEVIEKLGVPHIDQWESGWKELRGRYDDFQNDDVEISVITDFDAGNTDVIECIVYSRAKENTAPQVTYRWINPTYKDRIVRAHEANNCLEAIVVSFFRNWDLCAIYLDVDTFEDFVGLCRNLIDREKLPKVVPKYSEADFKKFFFPSGDHYNDV